MITTGAVTRPQMRVLMGSVYYPYSTKLALLASLPTDPDLFQPGPFIRCLELVDVGSSEYLGHCIREAGMGHQIPKPPRDHMIPINPPYGPQGLLGALVEQCPSPSPLAILLTVELGTWPVSLRDSAHPRMYVFQKSLPGGDFQRVVTLVCRGIVITGA